MGERRGIFWRQDAIVNARLTDAADEAGAAAAADAEGLLGLEVLIQIVEIHLELCRLTVEVDFDAGGQARAVVGKSDLMPSVGRQGLGGFDADGVIEPALDEIDVNLAFLVNELIAIPAIGIDHARENGATAFWIGID